jgi:hypothetical protein
MCLWYLYSVPTYGVRVLGALREERIGFNLRGLEHHVPIVAGAHLPTANDDIRKSSFVKKRSCLFEYHRVEIIKCPFWIFLKGLSDSKKIKFFLNFCFTHRRYIEISI